MTFLQIPSPHPTLTSVWADTTGGLDLLYRVQKHIVNLIDSKHGL